MPYKKIGTFHTDALYEIYDDLTEYFEAIADNASDITVVEPMLPDDPDIEPELWHDDYTTGDGAWVEAGEFDDVWAASGAASGFPDGDAMAIYDYADATSKLVVRMQIENSR